MKEEEAVSFKEYFVPFTSKKAIVFIVLLGLLVYLNSLFGEFLSDDNGQIVNNPFVHSISNLGAFFGGSTFYAGGELFGSFYRPLQTTYFSLVYIIFGAHAFPFHLLQVLFHITNTLLIFFIFRRWFSIVVAFVLSVLFLVHPMNVESVVFIAAVGVVLSALFGLIAIWLTLKKNPSLNLIFGVMGCLLFSLLFHESGIVFLVIVLLYKFIFDRKKLAFFFIGLIGVSLIYLLLRFGIASVSAVDTLFSPFANLSLSQRLVNIPSLVLFYFSSFLFPLNLAFTQRWVITSVNWGSFYLPLIMMFVLLGGIGIFGHKVYRGKKNEFKLFGFFFLWLGISLAPYLQIIPADVTVAERWFYVPMIALLGLIGVIFKSVGRVGFSKVLLVSLVVIVTLLSGRTIIRNLDWYSQITLFSHDLKNDPENVILLAGVGKEYYKEGNLDEAQIYLEKAVRLEGRAPTIGLLGNVYFNRGDLNTAKGLYEKSLEKDSVPDVVVNYALLLLKTGEPARAEEFIKSKMNRFSSEFELWLYLAIAEYRLGKNDEALVAAERAYQMWPNQQTGYVYNQLLSKKPLELPGL